VVILESKIRVEGTVQGSTQTDLQADLQAFWETVTRLGASKLILPFLLLMLALLVLRGNVRGAAIWAGAIGVAVGADFAWKVVYRATGVGVTALDFSAPSGHSLLSAAIYPVVLGWLFARGARARAPVDSPEMAPAQPVVASAAAAAQAGAIRVSRRAAASFASLREADGLSGGGFGLGVALALLVATSRLMLHFHSPAEAIAGFCIGYPASRVGRRALGRVSQPPRAMLLGTFVLMTAFGATLLDELPQLDLIRNVARGLTGRAATYERHRALVQMPPLPPLSTQLSASLASLPVSQAVASPALSAVASPPASAVASPPTSSPHRATPRH
jgi:membrane-associated phospholipid phosphatase